MDLKIDLSAHLLSNDDAIAAARLSARDETIDKAVKIIAERNERTAEQATILAQHEEIARLRAELEATKADAHNAHVDRALAETELEAAMVDAERYRWLRERGESFQWMNIIRIDVDDFDNIDAAIDAARGKDNG